MKHKALLFLFTIGLFMACSSDDSNGPSEPIEANYFPSAANSIWIYNVDNSSSSNPELDYTGTDLVTINSQTGNLFTINVNNDTASEFGVMNAILNSGTLNRSASTLALNGELPLPTDLDFLTITSFTLSNFLLYDLNAANNGLLSTISGVVSENIELNGGAFPLTGEYEISSTKTQNMSSLTVDGETFTNVITSEIRLNLNLSTTLATVAIPVIENQDILIIKNYFAEDVGLIKSEATQGYTLSASLTNLPDGTINFPSSLTMSNVQELDAFTN